MKTKERKTVKMAVEKIKWNLVRKKLRAEEQTTVLEK